MSSTCAQDDPQQEALPKTVEQKPQVELKSSMEILSELFSKFDAEPPVLVKKEKEGQVKKYKKSKKKHKHKDKKEKRHKKKLKKKQQNKSDCSSNSDSEGIDLSDLIKTEITLQGLISTEIKEEIGEVVDNVDTEQIKNSVVKLEPNAVKNKSNCVDVEKCKDLTEETMKNSKTKSTTKKTKASSLLKRDLKSHSHRKGHKRRKHEHNKVEEVISKKSRISRSRSRSKSKEVFRKERGDDKYHKSRDKSRSRSPRLRTDNYHENCDKYKDFETSYRSDKYGCNYKSKYVGPDDRNCRVKGDFHRGREEYRHREDQRHGRNDRRHETKESDLYKNHSDDRRLKDRRKEHTPPSVEKETRFDKKKLLEIARKNAIQMMKSGKLSDAMNLGPQAQEKVIAAISGGGKTIEELTDFCKALSRKEELGELSSVSSGDERLSDDEDMTIRHPFQIKEKSFIINIKNSVPLPTRTNQERASELRIQFPVSSGQHHRKTESEWVPVSPKKTEAPFKPAGANQTVATQVGERTTVPVAINTAPGAGGTTPLPTETVAMQLAPAQSKTMKVPPLPPPVVGVSAVGAALPGPQMFPPQNKQSELEIASIVSQRLAAMRKLQENPNDSQAMMEMCKAQKGMNSWAESKLPFGQFTGSTGANILSQAQLASGYQAWARKDQLQTAAPVSGGMGMHLLQKMGWRPGEGLGKEKTGALEPLLLEVKLDKKGVIAKEECRKKASAIRITKQTVKTLEGKHPVSLLHEYASKRKLGPPEYRLDFECGPDHMKNFLFKVILNGQEYKPNVASGNKKDAKAMAASICLQGLGLLPS